MHGLGLEYVKEAYESNWMSAVGANINEVEKQMTEIVEMKYAAIISAGTAEHHLSMKIVGIKPGDKVKAI